MGAYLGHLNKKQEERRIAAGRPGPVPDIVSLLSCFLLLKTKARWYVSLS